MSLPPGDPRLGCLDRAEGRLSRVEVAAVGLLDTCGGRVGTSEPGR